jgi:anti-sigma regulatory factor (Ser/Thr protein kinase)
MSGSQMRESQPNLPDPPPDAASMQFTLSDLPAVRRLVGEHATRAGLTAAQGHAIVLAVDELASNSIKHAGGGGELRVWTSGSKLLCEVHDRGQLTDQLAGRTKPGSRGESGWGLWLVNQLCEQTQVGTDERGTTIRVQMSGPGST